uniref:Uncharacterized protein n=1 Tax=Panagrolaimus sp. ES5 TaxID=591445 RepID=A0AC34FM41_9BILA
MSAVDIIPYFDQLPSNYQAAVTDLFSKLDSTFEDDEARKEYLKEFSEKHTIVPELWQLYFEIETNREKKKEILKNSIKHFITVWVADKIPLELPKSVKLFTWNHLFSIEQELFPMFVTRKNPLIKKEEKIVNFLSFPHKHLFYISKLYEEHCGPIPANIKSVVAKNNDLYGKLKEYFEIDPVKFFDTVMEIDNYEAKWSNIELLLSNRPYDKNIWEKYFIVLKENNSTEALLHCYHRYAGMFGDDMDLKNEIFKLNELMKSDKMEVDVFEESPKPSKSKELKKVIKNFTFQTAVIQQPPFREPLNDYIFKNSNPYVLTKLQSSTKFFLYSLKVHVIDRLEISDEPENFHKMSISLQSKNKLFSKLNNLYLINSLFLNDIKLTKIIPKIYRCDLKFLRIGFQKVQLKDFDFLVQHGNIELLSCHNIIEENNLAVPLEIILAKTPKIFYIELSGTQLTPQTFANLLKLEFQSKILYFSLDNVMQIIDVTSLVSFMQHNFGPNARINIEFDDQYPEVNYLELDSALDIMLNEWQPTEEKPQISLFLRPLFI